MKRKFIIALIIVLALIISLVLYKPLGCQALKKETWSYLYSQGYCDSDILSVKINHSYIAGLLGYGQWKTHVIFADEPYIEYNCVVKGKLSLSVVGLYAAGITEEIPQGYVFLHNTIK